jgi:hypothetical protein
MPIEFTPNYLKCIRNIDSANCIDVGCVFTVSAREDILSHVLDTVKEDKLGRFNLTNRRKNGRFDCTQSFAAPIPYPIHFSDPVG